MRFKSDEKIVKFLVLELKRLTKFKNKAVPRTAQKYLDELAVI